jgi:hypothetical protein
MRHAAASVSTGCPGWTFSATSGNNQAGYQRNNSYFSTTAAAQTTGGVQTAMLRQNGSMQATLTFPTNGTYTLKFRHCSDREARHPGVRVHSESEAATPAGSEVDGSSRHIQRAHPARGLNQQLPIIWLSYPQSIPAFAIMI